MWFLMFLLVICFLSIFTYFRYCFTYWKRLAVPQLMPVFPFGDMTSTIFRKQNMGNKIKEIYDQERAKGHHYVGLYFFSRVAFLPLNPSIIKDILTKDFVHFADRGLFYDEENDPLSAHLFSIAGNKWKALRTKLTPAYSPLKIKGMFDIICKCAEEMTDVIKEETMKNGAVEIKEILARYSTDVIGCCAFGLDCNSMRDPDAEFRKMGKRAFTQTIYDLFRIIIIRSFPSLARKLKFGIFSPNVTQFFRNVVKETIEHREKNDIKRKDFMAILMQLRKDPNSFERSPADDDHKEDEKEKRQINDSSSSLFTSFSTDELAAQAFIFFLAGFETTSTTMSFALFELALNNEIQNKVRMEIINVMNDSGKLDYDGLMEMKYLDQVLCETLRKYPPAPVFMRSCTSRYPIPNNQQNAYIEKGQTLLIPCFGLHRDPEYFPNPDVFDPDRFNDDNKGNIVDGSYIPFGAGPRNCIGMRFAMVQAKIALAQIILNYDLSLNEKTKLPLEMEPRGIIITPIGGLWINFIPRNCDKI